MTELNNLNWMNGNWIVDYCNATDKGVVIRQKDLKEFYFSSNYGLPALVPNYVRIKAKNMTIYKKEK